MPELPDAKITGMQELLVAFFFKQFVYYGSKALPIRSEGKDPKEDSDA